MKISFILLTGTFLLLNQEALARQFDKCTLAKELLNLGVPMYQLPDWVCLSQYESNYDTRAMNKQNTDGSWDWGIFQINDRYWCQNPDGRQSSNVCGISCNLLVNDDIRPDVDCAQKILQIHGFSAWVAWNRHCQNNKPTVHECF